MDITYGVQSYEWGKVGNASMVGKLKAASDSDFALQAEQPYAELWIGTHPKCPSVVAKTDQPLAAALAEEPAKLLSQPHVDRFGADVPFLLKVLSIAKALSIQAHPTLEHAKQLHARDPKNYPDPNHKPELLVALTPVEALAGFRKKEAIAAFAEKHSGTLRAILLAGSAAADLDLKALIQRLLSAEAVDAVKKHEAKLKGAAASSLSHEDAVFLRVASQFPGDAGALMLYVLNLVTLEPGQAIFLKPNEPHAYLSGDGVEIMAKSDNVVRAGLTPKFKDADTLLSMMTYDTNALDEMALPYNPAQAISVYKPPSSVPEFKLTMVKLGKAFPKENTVECASPSFILPVKGSTSYQAVTCDGDMCSMNNGTMTPGAVTFHAANTHFTFTAAAEDSTTDVNIDADAVVFIAETNDA
ncbi:Mannose-6-phosphate isomerase [Diplonema papillatum]|nr:Mannose-6-phosphate isomerase [Diplonema papillatum]